MFNKVHKKEGMINPICLEMLFWGIINLLLILLYVYGIVFKCHHQATLKYVCPLSTQCLTFKFIDNEMFFKLHEKLMIKMILRM